MRCSLKTLIGFPRIKYAHALFLNCMEILWQQRTHIACPVQQRVICLTIESTVVHHRETNDKTMILIGQEALLVYWSDIRCHSVKSDSILLCICQKELPLERVRNTSNSGCRPESSKYEVHD